MTEIPESQVVEFRHYTLHPGKRDVLIELFDREFIEPQEALGMRVMGQFRNLDDPDRFAWLRGFATMASRPRALQAFYGGPVWAAHRSVANATMVDSDDVLLLKPAWPGSGIRWSPGDRPAPGSTPLPRGILHVTIVHLSQPPDVQLVAFCHSHADASVLGWYVTEPAANNFPALPVREGVNVLVVFTLTDSEAPPPAIDGLERWQSRPPRRFRLAPTARSAIHA